MTVLVLGATGLLGSKVMDVLTKRGVRVLGAARSGADLTVDVSNQLALFRLLCRVDAEAVINCAANIDLKACEDDHEMAYRVNAAPAGVLATWSLQTEGRYIQVSTDHYFSGDMPIKNDEAALGELVNAYAASKFAGESMAREAQNSLILRTNMCGAQKGFGKWVLDSLLDQAPMSLFTDYYTSTMHVDACAEAIADLLPKKDTGIMNLASRDVSSKSEFVHAVADAMGIKLDWAVGRSVKDLEPTRATSCGLDVTRAEKALGRQLPTLQETANALIAEDPRCAMLTSSTSVNALSA